MHRGPDARRLAAVLVVACALLVVSGGRGAGAPDPAEAGAAAWRGFVDGERGEVAVGQRMIVVLESPSLADSLARGGRTCQRVGNAPLVGGRARGAEAGRGAALARGNRARAGLRLHTDLQRLCCADRQPGSRASRARSRRRRRLPRPGRIPRVALDRRAARGDVRARFRAAPRPRPAARLRRGGCHRRAPRHRRRRDAPVHPGPCPRGLRRARSGRPRGRPSTPDGSDSARAARYPGRGPDRRSERAREHPRRGARAPRSCRSALPAGS